MISLILILRGLESVFDDFAFIKGGNSLREDDLHFHILLLIFFDHLFLRKSVLVPQKLCLFLWIYHYLELDHLAGYFKSHESIFNLIKLSV